MRKLFLQGKRESDFLAMMSHEIQTPLNGVQGFLNELKRTAMTPVQERFVSAMAGAADNLSQLVDDILDHLKQRAGKIALKPKPERVRAVVSDCVRMFQVWEWDRLGFRGGCSGCCAGGGIDWKFSWK